jgi:uncharacterized protein with von Willebrand factor type A (vWA) domain
VTERLAPDLATLAAGLGELLRSEGVPASPERCARFTAAVGLAGPAYLERLYWLARVTLVDDPDQLEAFDRVFHRVFSGVVDLAAERGDTHAPKPPPQVRPGPRVRPPEEPEVTTSDVPVPSAVPGRAQSEGTEGGLLMTASVEERLRHKAFVDYTAEELATLQQLVARLRLVAPRRRARRTRRSARGHRLDVRRTLRAAHRTGGDPARRAYRRRRTHPRRVVLLADVSGSMEAYSRVYLQLLHGAVRGAGAEAFVLATRLTRLTRALSADDPDVALARAAAEATDWSGGTRLGETVKAFLDDYGRRGVARGAVVVVVSDGWERADPALLGEQMARLRRLAHRVVWVNPRSAAERYEPLAGGMAAALPHVDALVSGHSLAALDEVLALIADPTSATSAPRTRSGGAGAPGTGWAAR